MALWAADWPTFAHDAPRTAWAAEERALASENAHNPELKWKAHLKNEPRVLTVLTAPAVIKGVTTTEAIKTRVYTAGS
jgi:hypothetical protein